MTSNKLVLPAAANLPREHPSDCPSPFRQQIENRRVVLTSIIVPSPTDALRNDSGSVQIVHFSCNQMLHHKDGQ